LARREAAIVSPHAGTTRDVIEVHLDLGGYPVTLLDTAGIRDSEEPVEQEGVRRARERAVAADLVLWVTDLSASDPAPGQAFGTPDGPLVWQIRNKLDLARNHKNEDEFTFLISASRGEGVDRLIGALAAFAGENLSGGESALITRTRHREAFEATIVALDRSLEQGAKGGGEELIAEELRAAATALGRLTGRVDVEDILDVIFRDFCIGK
jgi:tRNA modification GTPase